MLKVTHVIRICTFLLIPVLTGSCLNDKYKCENTYYSITIKPFLYASCAQQEGCHNSTGTGRDFNKYSEVFRSKEDIIARITLDPNDDKFMPKGSTQVSAADLQMLKDWIAKGAPGCDDPVE